MGFLTEAKVAFAALIFALTAHPASAKTVILKCSFSGETKAQITYVLNTTVHNKVTVLGDFGSHRAKAFIQRPFIFVWEPNKGASVTTMIYLKAGAMPYAVRTTLGVLPKEDRTNSTSGPAFLSWIQKGYCPVQR